MKINLWERKSQVKSFLCTQAVFVERLKPGFGRLLRKAFLKLFYLAASLLFEKSRK
jgi:hypothetical protein